MPLEYLDPTRHSGEPDLEVEYLNADEARELDEIAEEELGLPAGWYAWFAPHGERVGIPSGPYGSMDAAIAAMRADLLG